MTTLRVHEHVRWCVGNAVLNQRLLVIDVGNSRTKFGLFDADDPSLACSERPATLPRCLKSSAVPVERPLPWEVLTSWSVELEQPRFIAVMAGANPSGLQHVIESWPAALGRPPAVLNDPATFGLSVCVAQPRAVGVDRLLNAVAVNVIRPAGVPAVIVDCGTATTVDLVAADGAFEGGAILPGFELAARSLNEYTALLPLVPVEELGPPAPPPLGRATEGALRSGLFWGQLGAVRELVGRLMPVSPGGKVPLLVLTGGGSGLLVPHLSAARHEPHLSLQGLAMVAARGGVADDSPGT